MRNILGTIGKVVGVGKTAKEVSDVANVWLHSDEDTQKFMLLVWTTLAPGLNVALAVAAVCIGIAAVGPWMVGSAAWLMRITFAPPPEPDLTVIGLLIGLVVSGKGADLLVQYLLDRSFDRPRRQPPEDAKEPPA